MRRSWWCHEGWCRYQLSGRESRKAPKTCSSRPLSTSQFCRTPSKTCRSGWSRGTPVPGRRGTGRRTEIWTGPIGGSPRPTRLLKKETGLMKRSCYLASLDKRCFFFFSRSIFQSMIKFLQVSCSKRSVIEKQWITLTFSFSTRIYLKLFAFY